MYEDFARIPRTAAAAAQSAGQPRPAGGLGGEGGAPGEPGAPGVPSGSAADAEAAAAAQAAAGAAGLAPPGADLRSRFISWLQRMDLAISKDRQAQLSQLGDGSGGVAIRGGIGGVAALLVCFDGRRQWQLYGQLACPAHDAAAELCGLPLARFPLQRSRCSLTRLLPSPPARPPRSRCAAGSSVASLQYLDASPAVGLQVCLG